jgi:hypothetical protein
VELPRITSEFHPHFSKQGRLAQILISKYSYRKERGTAMTMIISTMIMANTKSEGGGVPAQEPPYSIFLSTVQVHSGELTALFCGVMHAVSSV